MALFGLGRGPTCPMCSGALDGTPTMYHAAGPHPTQATTLGERYAWDPLRRARRGSSEERDPAAAGPRGANDGGSRHRDAGGQPNRALTAETWAAQARAWQRSQVRSSDPDARRLRVGCDLTPGRSCTSSTVTNSPRPTPAIGNRGPSIRHVKRDQSSDYKETKAWPAERVTTQEPVKTAAAAARFVLGHSRTQSTARSATSQASARAARGGVSRVSLVGETSPSGTFLAAA